MVAPFSCMTNKLARLNLPIKIITITLIILLAWTLRWRAVTMLPTDYDEDDYLRAAQDVAALVRKGDWAGLTQTNYRPEHPAFAKIIFGLSILPAPKAPLLPDLGTDAQPSQSMPQEQLLDARTSGAVFGTLTAGLLALVNPLAGLFLAVHAMTIKYDSEVMLEALPAFTSLAMILAYIRYKKNRDNLTWLMLSGIFLGLTAASKYIYCVAGLAVLADWFFVTKNDPREKHFIRNMALWVFSAMIVFFLADPYLWPDPIGRLKDSILYHAGYSTGASEVQSANFPIWQPLIWLNTSPYWWQDKRVFYLGIDPLIALFAAFGLTRLWKKEPTYILWLGLSLLFLFLWPTKWPQYIIIMTAPLCLAAVYGAQALCVQPVQSWLSNRKLEPVSRITRKDNLRQALPWLIPGIIAFAIFTLTPLIFQLGFSLTDFNSISIRDGLNGGIWRAVWGGLTGTIPIINPKIPYRSLMVGFTGPSSYLPVIDMITGSGILVFNILWTIFSVGLQTGLGLGTALILQQRGLKFKRGWEMLFILPWAIPEMIGALMWYNVFAPTTGWLSLAVQTYGKNIPFGFFTGWEKNPNMTAIVLLIAAVWYGFPFMMLAASAGLKAVPVEVFDAVKMDGANAWQTFRYVTWPLLMPLMLPAIIIRGVFAFNQFYLFQAFGKGPGTLATLSYNIFNPSSGYSNGQFAISAALNILTMLILVGFVILFDRWSKAGEGVTYA